MMHELPLQVARWQLHAQARSAGELRRLEKRWERTSLDCNQRSGLDGSRGEVYR